MPQSIALVICTYNNAPLLARCLDAISQQHTKASVPWQVLVVNNNCTDDTGAVVSRYQSKIPHLTMVRELTHPPLWAVPEASAVKRRQQS